MRFITVQFFTVAMLARFHRLSGKHPPPGILYIFRVPVVSEVLLVQINAAPASGDTAQSYAAVGQSCRMQPRQNAKCAACHLTRRDALGRWRTRFSVAQRRKGQRESLTEIKNPTHWGPGVSLNSRGGSRREVSGSS